MPNQLGQIALSGRGGIRDKGGERGKQGGGQGGSVGKTFVGMFREGGWAREMHVHSSTFDAGIYATFERVAFSPSSLPPRRDRDESYMHDTARFHLSFPLYLSLFSSPSRGRVLFHGNMIYAPPREIQRRDL